MVRICWSLSVCWVFVCLSFQAHGATLTVSNLNDSGAGSLRAQVAAATAGDNIDFGVTGIITLSTGEIAIAKNLTIGGPQGTPGITISSNGASRVFNISSGTVLLSRLTLSGGNGGATGGSIHNSGALTLLYCSLTGNSATNGAGIYNTGSATVDSCTLSGNSGVNGGAIYNYINANLMVRNSTLAGNSVGGGDGGGGIYNLGATTITSSTIVGNSAAGGFGGGINQGNYAGSFSNLSNSILAGNTGAFGGSDDYRGVVSGDYNLVQNAGSQGDFGSNTITGLDPRLGVLSDNGGPTKTIALLSDSQAINAGNPAFDAGVTPYDQRAEGYARKIGNAVDLGAVESAFTTRMPTAVNTSFTVTPNTPFSGTLPASDRDSGDTLTYTILTGTLPAGLTFDPATGIISGTTGGFAARTLTFKATDNHGADSNTATATLGAMEINSLLVNTNSDAANNTDGLTSIREAVAYANTGNAGAAPVITFAGDVTGIITLTSGVMTISRSMTIIGPGAGSLALTGINGSGARSIFNISAGTVNISALSLKNGYGTFYSVVVGGMNTNVRSGGALYITGGTVNVTNSSLSNNPASLGYGGAIFMTGGGLTISNCTLSQNSSKYGGAICLRGSTVVTITNSTLADNDAQFGGAVYTSNSTDEITIRNSTLSGNDATGAGGGILTNAGPVTIANSTLSGNRALGGPNGRGGGILIGGSNGGTTITNCTLTKNVAAIGGNLAGGGGISGGPVNMSNTIVCGNSANGGSANIASTTITGTNNLIDQDAMLNDLADNGGPTKTHKPKAASPAVDAGDPNFDITNTPYDQRGAGFTRILGGRMDIGAYETERNQSGSVVVVNTLADGDDGAAGLSNCTLREAVNYAPAGSTITFSVTGVITLTQGEIVIAKNLTIAVPSDSSGVTVSGNNASRIFRIDSSFTNGAVQLERLTLSGGNGTGASSNDSGGAMINLVTTTTVTVNECSFSGNSCSTSGMIAATGGGAIRNNGMLIVTNCTFSGNSAGNGGAIRNDRILTLTNSTFSGNSASSKGGGIYNPSALGSLTLSNSTLSGNSADLSGGGIFIANTAPVAINNSIVAGNYATTGPDISGAITTGGYNLVGNGDDSTGLVNASNGNQIGTAGQPVDPKLGTLTANGGPTPTLAFLPGSPAIDAGSNALIPVDLTTDQRAFSRIDNGVVDIGAFEVQPPPPLVSISPSLAQNEGDSGTTSFLFTVTRSGDTARTSTVAYSVAARTATAGVDYGDATDSDGGSPGIINFAAGQTNASIVIPVVGDQGLEPDETFAVTLSRAVLTGTPTVFGTIQNDDSGLVVTTNSDTTPDSNDNNNTLREAVARALSTLSGTNPGVSFAPNVSGEIVLNSALPNLSRSMTVTGPGASLLTIRPATNFAFTVFTNNSGVSSTLSGLTASKGSPGISNSGTLTLLDCVVTANRSNGGTGGGIYNSSALSLTGCVVSDNQAISPTTDSSGGGISSQGGSLSMVNCTVANNTVSGSSYGNRRGGGIHASAGTVVNLMGCTVSGNLVTPNNLMNSWGQGAGIYVIDSTTILNASNCTLSGNATNSSSYYTENRGGGICQVSGIVTLANCTVSGNTARDNGGGLFGTFTLWNTIVAGNTCGSGPDVSGTLISQGYNLIGNSSGATFAGTTTGNQLDVNPQLGVLTSNGGPTQTHAILAGSPAFDAGDPNFDNTATPYDQRGFVFLRKSSSAIDIGAYEVQVGADTTPPTISISAPSVTLANPGGTVLYTVTYADGNFGASTLSASNVTLNRVGTINASVSVTSSNATTRTITLSGITGYGTLGISIVAGTATDSSGNIAPAAGPSGTFTVNPSMETVQNSNTIRAMEGGGYEVGYVGNPGQEYTIQFSPDLVPPWQTLVMQTASSSGVITIIDNPPVGTPRRFYRLVIP